MTSYNREKYIAEAIESVLASTFQNFELLIVDDCSTDNTVEIAKSFELRDSRVKVFKNDTNLAQFGNRNKAASYSRGEFIKYFDSDDVMFPNCLEVTLKSMQAFPKAGAGCEHKVEVEELPVCYKPHELYINHYFKGNLLLLTGPTDCIFRKVIFEEFGGFREDVGILADTLLMLEIAAKYPVVGFDKGLTFYRIHDEQVTIGQLDWAAMLIERFKINEIVLNHVNCPLSISEIDTTKRNLKNLLVRNLIKFSLKNNLSEVRKVFNETKLSLIDCLFALTPNGKL